MAENLRPCWQNCIVPDDESFLDDKELAAIDAMEDSIAPLDDDTVRIRQLITQFELCYHEADKQAELIVKAIGLGHAPEESGERPPKRKEELQNCRDILSAWCEEAFDKVIDKNVGGVPADKLVSFIGNRTPLKVWQVQRIVNKVSQALDPSQHYHNMALDLGDYGEPGMNPAGQYYKDDSMFLEQTKDTIIHDTVDGHKAEISLAMAIDLLMPCHWDFVGGLVIILKAIGRDLHPAKPYACCSRNIKLSPLCDRMRMISNTLRAFWKANMTAKNIDRDILAPLGAATPVKRWLAASLDKTIRLHLEGMPGFWMTFS
ncbi:MAG: hypothetical protein ACETVZ_01095 [Phycisphaerae bacterium]